MKSDTGRFNVVYSKKAMMNRRGKSIMPKLYEDYAELMKTQIPKGETLTIWIDDEAVMTEEAWEDLRQRNNKKELDK